MKREESKWYIGRKEKKETIGVDEPKVKNVKK